MVTGIVSCNIKLPDLPTEDHSWNSHPLWNYITLPQIIGNLKNFMVMKDKFC